MLAPMAYRRGAAVAAAAAAGAASALWRRTLAAGGGGLVPGQDTPVHEKELPDSLKSEFSKVSEHFPEEQPGAGSGGGGGTRPASRTSGGQGGEAREHPDEMQDPYR